MGRLQLNRAPPHAVSVLLSLAVGIGVESLPAAAASAPAYQEVAILTAAEGTPNGSMGVTVDLSSDGTTAVATGMNTGATGSAGVRVFVRRGSNWTQQGPMLTPGTLSPNGSYDAALSCDGNTMVVRAGDNIFFPGGAWIYTRTAGNWQLESPLPRPAGTFAFTGSEPAAISCDGQTALVETPDPSSTSAGNWTYAINVYSRTDSGWAQQAVLRPDEQVHPANLSLAVSSDGGVIAAGETRTTGGRTVWIYRRTSSGSWSEEAKLSPPADAADWSFGSSLALTDDGDTLLATGVNDVWEFKHSSAGWSWDGVKLSPGDDGGAGASWELALAQDGRVLLVASERRFLAYLHGTTSDWTQDGPAITPTDGKIGVSGLVLIEGSRSVAVSGDGKTAIFGNARYATGIVRIFQVAPAATSPPSAGAGGAAQNLTYGALGYPWVGAETINESTYDWGYRTCRSDIGAANCAALTITRKGVHYFESDPWRYYIRNCTSYVAWRLHSLGVPTKLLTGLGDAAGWATSAAAKGVSSGTTPKPGAVAIDPSAAPPHGHVAFIEAVNKDGTITVSEYNFFKRGSGDRWTGKPAAHGFTRYVYFGPYEGEPSGSFDSLEAATPGTARAAGWAADPDTPTSPINVRFDVDGKANSTALANQRRADIGKAYAAYGPNHGFAATLTLAAGRHNVCVYALNVGFSSNQKLGCKTITVTAPPPPPQVQVINVAVCPHSDTTQIGNDPYTGAPGYRCNRDYSGSSFPAPPAVECSATILNGSGKQFTIELLRGDGSVLEAAPTEVAAASPWAADVYRTVDPGFTIPPGSYRCVVQVGGVTFADVAFTLG